ncbi:MAG: DUF1501 domain-containing protein [Bryobacteraceae bacterium]
MAVTHGPVGLAMWMAGGSVNGGTVFCFTGELGYRAVEQRVRIHDFHATMLQRPAPQRFEAVDRSVSGASDSRHSRESMVRSKGRRAKAS